jgi:hypothetical protein
MPPVLAKSHFFFDPPLSGVAEQPSFRLARMAASF